MANINIAVALLRLKPVYKELEAFRSPAFFSLINDILYEKNSSQSERKLLLMIAETYARLSAVAETFDESLVAALPQLPADIDPARMIAQVRALSKLMAKGEDSLFSSFARLTGEASLIIAAAITLKPFINEKTASVKTAMTASDKLLLYKFFEGKKDELRLNEEELHQLMHMSAIFAVCGYRMEKVLNKKPLDILAFLLEDEEIRTATRCNEYQGITWYNKEMMQLLIVLSALSVEVFIVDKKKFDSEKYVAKLLEKEDLAEYRLDKLLS